MLESLIRRYKVNNSLNNLEERIRLAYVHDYNSDGKLMQTIGIECGCILDYIMENKKYFCSGKGLKLHARALLFKSLVMHKMNIVFAMYEFIDAMNLYPDYRFLLIARVMWEDNADNIAERSFDRQTARKHFDNLIRKQLQKYLDGINSLEISIPSSELDIVIKILGREIQFLSTSDYHDRVDNYKPIKDDHNYDAHRIGSKRKWKW